MTYEVTLKRIEEAKQYLSILKEEVKSRGFSVNYTEKILAPYLYYLEQLEDELKEELK